MQTTKFNNREQEIIRKLVNYNFTKLNTLGRFLEDDVLFADVGLATLCLKTYDKNVFYINTKLYNTEDKLREGLFLISEIFLLLKKLRKEGLIICVKGLDTPEVSAMGFPNIELSKENSNKILIMDGGDYIRNEDLDWCDKSGALKYKAFIIDEKEIQIRELINSLPFISQELISLVKRNFISEDEIRFKKELYWARGSFIIAFIGVIFAIISSSVMETSLNRDQFNTIINNQKVFNKTIEENNSLLLEDSISPLRNVSK